MRKIYQARLKAHETKTDHSSRKGNREREGGRERSGLEAHSWPASFESRYKFA